jgi:hypothetical protein
MGLPKRRTNAKAALSFGRSQHATHCLNGMIEFYIVIRFRSELPFNCNESPSIAVSRRRGGFP